MLTRIGIAMEHLTRIVVSRRLESPVSRQRQRCNQDTRRKPNLRATAVGSCKKTKLNELVNQVQTAEECNRGR